MIKMLSTEVRELMVKWIIVNKEDKKI